LPSAWKFRSYQPLLQQVLMEFLSELLLRCPKGLVHPFTVCVTEYVPAVVTVMDEVVAALLHTQIPRIRVCRQRRRCRSYQPLLQQAQMELLAEQLHRCLKDWYSYSLFG
jgi:hypothetical protein